jgi:AhpD family alkylhydroperoxidase
MTSPADARSSERLITPVNERTPSVPATPQIRVFDPPMCCSTGVCGPVVDPKLTTFAGDLDWLAAQGVAVTRFNLAQQPQAFVSHDLVRAAIEQDGEACLPLVLADALVVSRGSYPSREALAKAAGISVAAEASLYTEAVAELVAIGASIAANCEPCFKAHYDRARKLGVSKADMARAVKTAQAVKEAPASAMLALADRYLRDSAAAAPTVDARGKGTLLQMAAPGDGCGTPGSGCC